MSYENDVKMLLENGYFTKADAANIWATLAVLDELRKIKELLENNQPKKKKLSTKPGLADYHRV